MRSLHTEFGAPRSYHLLDHLSTDGHASFFLLQNLLDIDLEPIVHMTVVRFTIISRFAPNLVKLFEIIPNIQSVSLIEIS